MRAPRQTYSQIIGIDGEAWNVGADDPQRGREHLYGLLLAADEKGRKWSVSNAGKKLTTKQCLDFLFKLPHDAFIIAFSFKYDLSKMLEDLPDELLYKLNHASSANQDEKGVKWCPDGAAEYHIEYLGSKFTVRKGAKTRTVWDLFKFYQTSFVKTCKIWKVEEDLKLIEEMKKKRGEFQISEMPEIEHYCFLECRNLARLGRKLLGALNGAKLDLEDKFHGAGSVGAAVLKRMNAEEESQLTKMAMPEAMNDAVIRAFFGGRFEISQCGPIPGQCWEYDISSAYPYQIYRFPCLRHTCGSWELTSDRARLNGAKAALVHYDLSTPPTVHRGWGPFPYRTDKGTSTFPVTSGGGWVWLEEYLNGERFFDNVKFVEAWVWTPNGTCTHSNPFKGIADLYIERCRLGKGDVGIVIKLGYNAAYGKMAQSVGHAVFNNWAWAGMITSGCRAQLLGMMGLHKDWSNILMVATDGIYTREEIEAPAPECTGTGPDVLKDEKGNPKNAPLGGWEKSSPEEFGKGLFLARPGIYFSLDLWKNREKEVANKVKCRGIGLKTLTDSREAMIEHFIRTGGSEPFQFELDRFHGMKTCIGKKRHTASLYPVDFQELYYRRPYYGRWKHQVHQLSFSPAPKRGPGFVCRALPDPELEGLSRPYSKAVAMAQDEETIAAVLDADSLLEQPDLEDNE